MIYTCTTNPSLDYYLKFKNQLEIGDINRCTKEQFAAGGKGVNVSIILNNLMIPSTALGFLGGFTRDYYLSFLKQYPYIQPRFTTIEGNTRINVKLSAIDETDINATGPYILKEEFEKFMNRIDRIDGSDTFILSGNVQTEIYDDIVNMIDILSQRNVRIILDTNPKLMADCLKFKPLLVKPNLEELEELCEKTVKDEQAIIKCASKLVENGAQNVIVSMGADGAMLINSEGAYKCSKIIGDVISTTGCGDSMVGAYVFNLQRGANAFEAFHFACAAGYATAFKEGLANREDIENIYKQITIERI